MSKVLKVGLERTRLGIPCVSCPLCGSIHELREDEQVERFTCKACEEPFEIGVSHGA
jgi:transposase-like protein